MTRRDELLAAIRASDETDDQPRLVFADWLEQEGQLARADLIRRQCELAREPAWSRRAGEARLEIEHLLAQHGAAWRAELPRLDGVEWLGFERGFVTSVKVDDVIALHTHAEAIEDAAPVHTVELKGLIASTAPRAIGWLRTLRLHLPWNLQHVATVRPLLATVRVLEFPDAGDDQSEFFTQVAGALDLEELAVTGEHTMGAGVVARLGERAVGSRLRRLAVGTEFIDEDTGYFADPTLRLAGAQALARLRLAHLEVLGVAYQRITNVGFEMLIGSLPRLRDLDVRGCELTALPHLADPGTPLVRLRASYNPLGDVAGAALAASPRLATCEVLELRTCELGEAAVRALVAAPCWHTLRSLELARNPLGFGGALALAEAAPPAALHRLALRDCDFTEAAARVLASCHWLGQLGELDLRANAVSAHAIAALASIRVLRLAGATLVDAELDYLAPLWPHLIHADLRGLLCGELLAGAPELQTLRLAGCTLDATALGKLATGSYPRLRVLDLSDQPISAASLAQLLESPLGRVQRLVLANTNLDGDAIAYLASRGAARVEELDLGRNELPLPSLLSLGRSTALRGVKLHLNGSPWNHPPAVRTQLATLLGAEWFHYHHSFPEDEID